MAWVAPLALVSLPLAAMLALHRPGKRESFLAALLVAVTLWGWTAGPATGEPLAGFGTAWTLLLTGSLVAVLGARPGAAARPVPTALAAIGCAATGGLLLVAVTSYSFGQLSWEAGRQFMTEAHQRVSMFAVLTSRLENNADLVAQFESSVLASARFVVDYLPGLVLLQSLAALALGWSFYRALARHPEGAPLPRLKEFRFNDHLIWGVVAALLILVLPRLGPLAPLGGNLAAFFGGLYLIRGLGVIAALFGGLLTGGGAFFAVVALLLLAPLAGIVALALGVTDTWVDWRTRAARAKK